MLPVIGSGFAPMSPRISSPAHDGTGKAYNCYFLLHALKCVSFYGICLFAYKPSCHSMLQNLNSCFYFI